MKKAEKIQAYFMRVDEVTGQPYRGYLGEIENTLKAYQKYVSFDKDAMNIEVVPFSENLLLICNENGKVFDYPANRAFFDEHGRMRDVIRGNVLVVRCAGEEFASIQESDISEIVRYLLPVSLKGSIPLLLEEELLPEYKEGYSDAGAD